MYFLIKSIYNILSESKQKQFDLSTKIKFFYEKKEVCHSNDNYMFNYTNINENAYLTCFCIQLHLIYVS